MISDRLGQALFESDEVRKNEITHLLSLKSAQACPDSLVKAVGAQDEKGDEYTIPLMIGDDPHHRGSYTEKASSLANFCGEAYVEISPDLAVQYEIKEGDSVRVESRVGKLILPARISDFIDNKIVFIPRNFSSTSVTSLLMRKQRIDMVKISKVES
jgi:predicted molibdopterin-dependent oxidoreductase YjgC